MSYFDQSNVIESKNNEKKKRNIIVKSLIAIILFLFFLSVLLLVIRLGDFLPNNIDVFFIEPKKPTFVFGNDDKIWDEDTRLDIFEISSTNNEGKVTVLSGTGDKIIAPGMQGSYQFKFQNKGNIAIDYNCTVNVMFTCTNGNIDSSIIPIEVRMQDYTGEYLIGSEEEWAKPNSLINYFDEYTIGRNSYVYYIFEWRWLFESGNDELDTYLGNLSDDTKTTLTVNFSAYANQSSNYKAKGGIPVNKSSILAGGDLVPLPYILLNLLLLIVIIILVIYDYLQRNKKSKEVQEVIDNIEIPSITDEENDEVIETPQIQVVDKVDVSEVNDLISDNDAYMTIQTKKVDVDKSHKAIVNIDTISLYFNANETVTLETMKQRIPGFKSNITYVKVLARGTLDKPLIIEANDFSIEAVKMIVLTGGKVICTKNK